jgi:type I restriction enzyme, S subunit
MMRPARSKTSSDVGDIAVRAYDRIDAAAFRKTTEKFGGLSNMAAGFPLIVAGFAIRTSEALYQACRFPHMPDVQKLVIEQESPMTAKMKTKPFRDSSRPDWDQVRVPIMRWCLRVKLIQNWDRFSDILISTADRPIVEDSRRDDFWGAIAADSSTLEGRNVLGRLLMELRSLVHGGALTQSSTIEPLRIENFRLCERPIGIVTSHDVAEHSTPERKPTLFD